MPKYIGGSYPVLHFVVMFQQIKAMADSKISVVVSAGKFGDLYVHFLNKYGIMGVRLNSKFDLRRLCKATGATALPRIVKNFF